MPGSSPPHHSAVEKKILRVCVHVNERCRRKEERSKQGQTNNKAWGMGNGIPLTMSLTISSVDRPATGTPFTSSSSSPSRSTSEQSEGGGGGGGSRRG